MKNNYFYFGAILDRSGSMGDNGKISEALNGFNDFVNDKKTKDYEADIMVTIFDDKIDTIYNGSIKNCIELSKDTYFPRGMTALYDAIGKTVSEIGTILSGKSEDEKPSKVIVAVITDGLENVSKEFTSQRIGDIIKEQQEKYSWEFLFMGADQKAILDAQKNLNFKAVNTMHFADNSIGVKAAYASYSRSVDLMTAIKTEEEK
jgi:hypothetical protein